MTYLLDIWQALSVHVIKEYATDATVLSPCR